MEAEKIEKAADDIMRAAQLASALEVSATPKPGNIHREADYPPTRFEHFLAGAVALGPAIREAALQGGRAACGGIGYSDIGIGRWTKKAVLDVGSWHRGGNTHLGICMLFTPLAAAAGALAAYGKKIDADGLRLEARKILETTTSKDAAELHGALSALDAAWLGRIEAGGIPDMDSEEGLKKIVRRRVTLRDLMKASAGWDGIAAELSNSLHISFTIGYPVFTKTYGETGDVNTSTVNTYLKILSEVPDTFVARKIGLEETRDIVEAVKIGRGESLRISQEAKRLLETYGGLRTERGRREIRRLDQELKSLGRNPGTTADITAASLLIALLTGFRP